MRLPAHATVAADRDAILAMVRAELGADAMNALLRERLVTAARQVQLCSL